MKLLLLLFSIYLGFIDSDKVLLRKPETKESNEKELNGDKYRKSLVSIKSRTELPFVTDTEETTYSTGFIVDIDKGLVVTNRKTARFSPSFLKVQFYDGTIKNGRIMYTDTIVPFGIIQIEGFGDEERSKYVQLKLGKAEGTNFHPGSSVSIMGTTQEGSYVYKTGKIINSNRNFSSRYGGLFQTSFDRVTNLSGSPVWNENDEVVGMHVLSTDTTSYELKINYVTNILDQIKSSSKNIIKRGDIGISIDLVILGIAKINYKLRNSISEEISKKIETSGGPPELMVITSVYPLSPSNGILKPGDIIYKIDENIIGNDFLLLDSLINKNVGNSLKMTVSRNGTITDINIPKVDNTEEDKINRYISFSGAYFHEINAFTRYYLYTDVEGIYLTFSNNGSPFSKVSIPNQNNKNNYILTSINSHKIKNLHEFSEFFKTNCNLESIYVEGIDFNVFSARVATDAIDLDFSNSLLQISKFDENKLKWEINSLDLNKYCQSKADTDKGKSENKTNANESIKSQRKAQSTVEQDSKDLSLLSNIKFEDESSFAKFKENKLKKNSTLKITETVPKNVFKFKEKGNLDIASKLTDTMKLAQKVNSNATSINLIKVGINQKGVENKKIQNKDKNMLDHLTDLHKFRINL